MLRVFRVFRVFRMFRMRGLFHASILHPPTDIRSSEEITHDQDFACGKLDAPTHCGGQVALEASVSPCGLRSAGDRVDTMHVWRGPLDAHAVA
ncbi:hypothetical protein GCM10023152_07620 [Agromyces bauzanensis]|uniref:Uncharacterized protein n=1 Tax=Agromyces bauzanensis TaxID=1308924 RepID=A0A917UVS7_9MICO|nr:hypothetical protein GCM10011372_29470 [Agromyces bauzanensis]